MIPKALSVGEETFAMHMKARGLVPEREYRFDPERKWRFDFAFPWMGIAVEVDGGAYSQGRHTRGKGFAADCEKMNRATILGWRVFRFTTEMVKSGEADRFIASLLGQ